MNDSIDDVSKVVKSNRGAIGKYCPEIVTEICKSISDGLSIKDSCFQSGISQETYYNWKQLHIEFVEAVKKAENEFKRTHLQIIAKAAVKNWFAAAWLLERKFKEEFAQRVQTDHSGYIESSEDKEAEKKRRDYVEKLISEFSLQNLTEIQKVEKSG